MKPTNGTKLLYGLTVQSRKALMLAMREAEVNDSQIGKVIGISRERVAQCIGRQDREIMEEKRYQAFLDKATPLIMEGISITKIALTIGTNQATVRDIILELMPIQEYLKRKRSQRQAVVTAQLLEFLQKTSLPLTQYYLQIYDNNLSSRALKFMKIPQWREYLGVETKLFTRKPSVAREDII